VASAPENAGDPKTAIPAELDKTVRIWESEGQTVSMSFETAP